MIPARRDLGNPADICLPAFSILNQSFFRTVAKPVALNHFGGSFVFIDALNSSIHVIGRLFTS